MIAALFVPLSECSRGGKPPTTPVPSRTLLQKTFPRSDAQTDYDYGVARLGLSINGIATLIAFGWPLVLALINQSIAEKRRAWILHVLELSALRGNDLLDSHRDIGREAALGHIPRVRPDGRVRNCGVSRSGVRSEAQICSANRLLTHRCFFVVASRVPATLSS